MTGCTRSFRPERRSPGEKMESEEIRTVRLFNQAINRHDVERLCSLMAADHAFIDSGGTVTTGVNVMKDGWRDFFEMFPDYRNEFSGYLQNGDTVMAFGRASGTYNGKRGLVPENRITMPAAWRAIVQHGRVLEWQVYADWSEGGKTIEEDERAEV
jgi:ketosteroid isomerase-like protein